MDPTSDEYHPRRLTTIPEDQKIPEEVIPKKEQQRADWEIVVAFIRKIFRKIRNWFRPPKASSELARYVFSQQYNDSCHIGPIRNLQILQQIRKNGYQWKNQIQSYSRRQWLAENQDMLKTWHTIFSKIRLSDESFRLEYPKLYQYIQNGIREGPKFPEFYNEKGKLAFTGIKGLIEFSSMPLFLEENKPLPTIFAFNCGRHGIPRSILRQPSKVLKLARPRFPKTFSIVGSKTGLRIEKQFPQCKKEKNLPKPLFSTYGKTSEKR